MPIVLCSRKAGYYSPFIKCFCLNKNGISIFANVPFLINPKINMNLRASLFNNFPKYIHSTSHKRCEPDGDINEEVIFPVANIMEFEDYSEQFRNTLYPITDDRLMIQLKSCDSLKSLSDTVTSNISNFTPEHFSQFLLVFWDLVKHHNYYFKYNNVVTARNTTVVNLGSENEISNLNPFIFKALASLSINSERLTPHVLACSILYSKRLGVDMKNSLMQSLLMRMSYLLDNEEKFPLSALSRLSIALVDNEELWAQLFLVKAVTYIYKNFDKCESAEDFRALTISMLSTVSYLNEDVLVAYEALSEEFLRNGVITRRHTSIIVKMILLLNNIYHIPLARYMMYKLFHMLNGTIKTLFIPHLLDLQKVIWQNVEPQYTLMELESFKKMCSVHLISNPELSQSYVSLFVLPHTQQGLLFLKKVIQNSNQLETLMCIQPQLSTTHIEICHMFWDKVVDLMTSAATNLNTQLLTNICRRYLIFTARMRSYRQKEFESKIISLIAQHLVEGVVVSQPRLFAPLAAFVLAFDRRSYGSTCLSFDIVPHLISMIGQFNVQCCLLLSRGLNRGLRYQRDRELKIYLQLDAALKHRTREILNGDDNKSINTVNMIFRSCINSQETLHSDLLFDILKRCEQLDWSQLTSRSLRNMVYNFYITSSLVPAAVDRMVEYCLQNQQYVTGDTISKVATLCYYLGYAPAHLYNFCDVTADLVTRDCEMLMGLSLLQVALALSFFNQLPSSLNRYIFTVDFLEKLDNEIKNCFAKDRYPQRVRQVLMELNRSVCIDQPEANIPWFHSKYCEEQQSLRLQEVRTKSLMYTDVLSTLSSLVGGSNFVNTKAFAPYGYILDMQVNLDASLNPLPSGQLENVAHKLAFVLYYGENYTVHDRRLKGSCQMKKRHLEILGYKVITISDSLWNAMFMAEPKAKLDYTRNLLWPS